MLTVSDPASRGGVPQDTPEWVRERIGKLTASRMCDVLATSKRDGKPLKARQDYAFELVAERMCDSAMDHYVTEAMERGILEESGAADMYAEVTGNEITRGLFVPHPTIECFGGSPDYVIAGGGLVEIKNPNTTKYLMWRRDGIVPEEHKAQMLAQMACTGARFVDFVGFDSRIKFRPHRIYVRRFEPDPALVARVEHEARKFLAEVDALFYAITHEAALPAKVYDDYDPLTR